jgi:hypothetical protein
VPGLAQAVGQGVDAGCVDAVVVADKDPHGAYGIVVFCMRP